MATFLPRSLASSLLGRRGATGALLRTPSIAPSAASRLFTSKKKKKKNEFATKKVSKNYPRWEFLTYLEKKDPKATFWDPECEGQTFIGSMLLERTPRLSKHIPSWKIEWDALQDEIKYHKLAHAPAELLENQKSLDEEAEKVFKPNPRVTHADLADDRRSLWRCLDSSTFLIVQTHNDQGDPVWNFPSKLWHTNETMRETAENSLVLQCGNEIDSYLLGNAPIGHLAFGSNKQFLFRNIWQFGNVELGEGVLDYAWVTAREFEEYLSPELQALCEKVIFEEYLH